MGRLMRFLNRMPLELLKAYELVDYARTGIIHHTRSIASWRVYALDPSTASFALTQIEVEEKKLAMCQELYNVQSDYILEEETSRIIRKIYRILQAIGLLIIIFCIYMIIRVS